MNIAIVNDVPLAVESMRRIIAGSARHKVAWIARDGAEAVAACAREKPDLILMDLIMPVMDGVEATRRIMKATPCPILVVTATVDGNSARVFEALGAGALDAVNTPASGDPDNRGKSPLLVKIDMLGLLIGAGGIQHRPQAPAPSGGRKAREADQLVAIGASAGGPAALAEVLRVMPPDFPAAIVVVQHVDEQFARGFADWLGQQSNLPVRVAAEGGHPVEGTVLIAGKSDHLIFNGPNSMGYTPYPEDYVYRPSVDVFFESIVRNWRGKVVGVLLTGMGRDGARGLKALRDAGSHTIAQDKETSAVYGMPKAAAALGAAVEILPLREISAALKKRIVGYANRKKTLPL